MSRRGMTILAVETAKEKEVSVDDSKAVFWGNKIGAVRLYLTTIEGKPFAAWEYGKSFSAMGGYSGLGVPRSPLDQSITFSQTLRDEVTLDTDFEGPFLEESESEYDEKTGLTIIKERMHVVHPLGQATLILAHSDAFIEQSASS